MGISTEYTDEHVGVPEAPFARPPFVHWTTDSQLVVIEGRRIGS